MELERNVPFTPCIEFVACLDFDANRDGLMLALQPVPLNCTDGNVVGGLTAGLGQTLGKDHCFYIWGSGLPFCRLLLPICFLCPLSLHVSILVRRGMRPSACQDVQVGRKWLQCKSCLRVDNRIQV